MMDKLSELEGILKEELGWNKARLACFTRMLIALLTIRSVNLNKLAAIFSSSSQISSRYRRLQRFFALFRLDYEKIAGLIFKLFFIAGEEWYLTMDRTNWQWGKSDINVLMLGIVYRGAAIPIYWELLDKKGNSDTQERIELVQRFITRFGKASIGGILGDREFIGGDWFSWLLKEKLPFYIRIKQNHITTNAQGLEVEINALFYGLALQEKRILKGKRQLFGQAVYLGGLRLDDGELLIIATSEQPDNAIEIYALRWQIETLFGCFKGRGFNFEDTHITTLERIKKLLVLLAIAFTWAHKTGEWRHETIKKIKVKKHGRLAVSYFRYGLDFLADAIIKIHTNNSLFQQSLERLTILPTYIVDDNLNPIKNRTGNLFN